MLKLHPLCSFICFLFLWGTFIYSKDSFVSLETSRGSDTPWDTLFIRWFLQILWQWINLRLIGQAIIPITQAQLHRDHFKDLSPRTNWKCEMRSIESTATIWVIPCKLFFIPTTPLAERSSTGDKFKLTSLTSSQFINLYIGYSGASFEGFS